MAFHGVFIGIDRHLSPHVGDLTCAVRDAKALAALFEDTLGGSCTLLTDADATREAVIRHLDALSACHPDDTVFVAFSGHGTDDHKLVTHDTDLDDLEGTALSLVELERKFINIQAGRLLLVLDCCFSGGMGAKVLKVDARSRSPSSAELRLAALAGEGRLILTASAADQPAWEDVRRGHGLLTSALVEALSGTPEVMDGTHVSLMRLVAHVVSRVQASAIAMGKDQLPGVRAAIEGDVRWPVFVRGARWEQWFPAPARAYVDHDPSSLARVGFPTGLVAAWSKEISSLNDLQVEAINDYGILRGEHLVVSAPTSSGKTMVGELAALTAVISNRRAIFLLPLKALVADKRRHFTRLYGPYGVRTFEATGETDDIGPLLRGKYDIALLTYEKFCAVAVRFPHVLSGVGVIVVDEAQMLADIHRGANLEFLLTLVLMRRRTGAEPQIVALSAVVGDAAALAGWLGARLLRHIERPVPLDEGLILRDGSFRHLVGGSGEEVTTTAKVSRLRRTDSNKDWIIPLVRSLVDEGQQVIVFRELKGEASGSAAYLAASLELPPAAEAVASLPERDPSRSTRALRACLAGGVAFHHSDLTPDERRIVEEEFRRPGSGLRVIAATTTLAMGVNTPANSVVICGLRHPGRDGPVPYSVAEYKNLVGRAGRLGYADRGTSYLLATSPVLEDDLWRRYVTAEPEDVTSRFLRKGTDVRTLIVRVIASVASLGGSIAPGDLVAFLEASFGAFLQRREDDNWVWDRGTFASGLDGLRAHGLVEARADGMVTLTPLGRIAGEGSIEVASVIRLVRAMRGLKTDEVTDPALLVAVQSTVELDGCHFPSNKKSVKPHHKEPQAWMGELRRVSVPAQVMAALNWDTRDEVASTLRAKKAVAALLFIAGKPMDFIETSMLQFGGGGDGAAGAVRNVTSRTCDMIPAAARVAELVVPGVDIAGRIERLLVRLTHGIPGATVDIARECGASLSRGDYLALAEAHLTEPERVVSAPDVSLLSCLGDDRDKLIEIRRGAEAAVARRAAAAIVPSPILEPYEA